MGKVCYLIRVPDTDIKKYINESDPVDHFIDSNYNFQVRNTSMTVAGFFRLIKPGH